MTSVLKGFGATLLVFVVCCSYTKHATIGKDGIEYMPNRYGFTRSGRVCVQAFRIERDDVPPDRDRRLTERWGNDLTRYLREEFGRVGIQAFDANSDCPEGVEILRCVLTQLDIKEDYFPPSGTTISTTNSAECELSHGGDPSRVRQYSGTGSRRYYIYTGGADFSARFQAGGEAIREMVYAIVTDTIGAMDKF